MHLVSTIKSQLDGGWIAAWPHGEIVFQFALISIIDKIDAWIDLIIGDTPIANHICAPFIAIVANKVIAAIPQLLLSGSARGLICPQQFQTQQATLLSCFR